MIQRESVTAFKRSALTQSVFSNYLHHSILQPSGAPGPTPTAAPEISSEGLTGFMLILLKHKFNIFCGVHERFCSQGAIFHYGSGKNSCQNNNNSHAS